MTDRTVAALASALPDGVHYLPDSEHMWRAKHIARYQAERLAASAYVLLHVGHVDDATVEPVAQRAYEDGWGEDNWDAVQDFQREFWRCVVRSALAALAAPRADEPAEVES